MIEVPGCNKADIFVEVLPATTAGLRPRLHVRVTRAGSASSKDATYHRSESWSGFSSRTLPLPLWVDDERTAVTALANGELRISAPRKAGADGHVHAPRRLAIE